MQQPHQHQQQYRGYAPQPTPRSAGLGSVSQRGRGGPGPMMSAGSIHHTMAVTNAQQTQQDQVQKAQRDAANRRSRKPTDKTLPDEIEEVVVGGSDVVAAYNSLRDFEQRLDATITRKRLDIADSVVRSPKRYKTLRIWITNTVENQIWQKNRGSSESFDFHANAEPSWRVTMQGKLLDEDDDGDDIDDEEAGGDGQQGEPSKRGEATGEQMDADEAATSPTSASKASASTDKLPKPVYQFSHLFKALSVEFERPPRAVGGGELGVEWKKPDRTPPGGGVGGEAANWDEFAFKRSGDENANIIINLWRHEEPERFELTPALAEIVDEREATRHGAVLGVFEYIRLMGLQEDDEKRNFRCDELLRKLVGRDMGVLPMLENYIVPHLRPLPPVKLAYTIRVDEAFHSTSSPPQPTVYDVRVAVEDAARQRLFGAAASAARHAVLLRQVNDLDHSLALLVQAVDGSMAKHRFMRGMRRDPAGFVTDWFSSQKRDLDVIMGEAARGGGEAAAGDEWRRGGKGGPWDTASARESVNVLLARQPAMRDGR